MPDPTATKAWPFGDDADRDDPLTKLRVPAVWSFNPMWKYVAAYIKPAPDENPYHWGSNARPTDAEAAMLASFIQEYLHHWFRDSYIARLAERPLDVDGGCKTQVFVKYGEDDWGYRVVTWEYGPLFVPESPGFKDRKIGPLSLVQVMDRRHTIGDEPMKHWLDWKAAYPDVFPALTEESK